MNVSGKLLGVLVGFAFLPGWPMAAGEDAGEKAGDDFFVYVGTYTGPKSKGIYVSRFSAATGHLSAPELAAETQNPTFLAAHPALPALYAAGRPLLYAANEVGWGSKSGSVSAYSVDRTTGRLTPLGQKSSGGSGPCHLSVDRSGKCLLVANYGGGSIAVLPIKEDGSLEQATAFVQHAGASVNKQRQEGPHAHWIDTSPDNRYALVCDLGLDKVMIYKLDPGRGRVEANEPAFAAVKDGAGPRHLVFHPSKRFAYVINEMGNTVTVFAFDARQGTLGEVQTVPTLPEGVTTQNSTAEVDVHPTGKFLYGSNRGHNSIAVYAIDAETGKLTPIQHQSTLGKTPRNFAVDPSGRWLLAANQGSDEIVVFRIDPATGRLTPAGQTIQVGAPVCVKFIPAK